MDLNTITEVLRPASADAVKEWPAGHAWLAGGTWLFSEPQVTTNTLVDLDAFKWPSLAILPDGLEIAATCKVAELDRLTVPPE
jgi:CO/xanthine dehydrogenase FAD-binding subunit